MAQTQSSRNRIEATRYADKRAERGSSDWDEAYDFYLELFDDGEEAVSDARDTTEG